MSKSSPKRIAEDAFAALAESMGWGASKRGWPTFFCTLEGKPFAVEASNRNLRHDQHAVMTALSESGFPCYRWSPDGGFEPVGDSPPWDDFKAGRSVGGKGGGVVVQEELNGNNSLEGGSGGKPFSGDIEEVWQHFVATMDPRSKICGPEEKSVIRAALKVASAAELKTAITSCFQSDYHMKRGEHGQRKGQKYNKLSQIIKGRRGRETTRERIDFFLDRAGEKTFPSAQRAIVAQRQLDVQRGHGSSNEDTLERAKESEAWLLQHGIETARREDGYPVFRPVVAGDPVS